MNAMHEYNNSNYCVFRIPTQNHVFSTEDLMGKFQCNNRWSVLRLDQIRRSLPGNDFMIESKVLK